MRSGHRVSSVLACVPFGPSVASVPRAALEIIVKLEFTSQGDPKRTGRIDGLEKLLKATSGPRLLRLFAQVVDGAGLKHATLVDLTPFSVQQ